MRLGRKRVIGPAVAQDGEQDEPLDEQEDDAAMVKTKRKMPSVSWPWTVTGEGAEARPVGGVEDDEPDDRSHRDEGGHGERESPAAAWGAIHARSSPRA